MGFHELTIIEPTLPKDFVDFSECASTVVVSHSDGDVSKTEETKQEDTKNEVIKNEDINSEDVKKEIKGDDVKKDIKSEDIKREDTTTSPLASPEKQTAHVSGMSESKVRSLLITTYLMVTSKMEKYAPKPAQDDNSYRSRSYTDKVSNILTCDSIY